ncbi:Inositol-trisphosphate 3-kinase B [Liparis tanakae]|uniref:Kinase n=1 Tax=Liparis tanakae TaxID=230148 RepID=A0A4Z2FGV2_9TELE|nr:Inositol-trisphosphate 3-kinase B [Liparis tanakae]
MDLTDEDHMEGTETERKRTVANDCSAMLSDEMHQHMTISGKPSSSCKRMRVRSRPRLKSTKSFPPYSQCIGGLGEGEEGDHELNSQSSNVPRDDTKEVAERKEDFELNGKCARDEVKAKWKNRRKERLWGSHEDAADGWERARCSGKRSGGESGRERERGLPPNSERKHPRGGNSSFEMDMKEEEEEERKRAPVAAAEIEKEERGENPEGGVEVAEELTGMRKISSTTPHPILSKLLQSSSSSSSSVNFSSAESDEVFSEGEDVGSRRRAFRKYRTWRSYLTVMHWSMRRQSSWVQLAGHQGTFLQNRLGSCDPHGAHINYIHFSSISTLLPAGDGAHIRTFQLSEDGEVLKLYSEVEAACLAGLMRDPLRPFVPRYHGLVTKGDHCYIRLEDLLSGLRKPVIMDCKMGVRTYQEEELIKGRNKATLRSDMYQKMVEIDPSALSEEEHQQGGVTKSRYLQWRDSNSSTATLGFRIEGVMMEDGSVQRDFRKIRTPAQVTEAFLFSTRRQLDILNAYHSRLLALRDALQNSLFFRTHEVIGSSLLFVHDHSSQASVWMIDFAKTTPVPDARPLRHNVPWAEGSREDGYLIGLSSLLASLSRAISVASWQQEGGCGEEKTAA